MTQIASLGGTRFLLIVTQINGIPEVEEWLSGLEGGSGDARRPDFRHITDGRADM